MKTDAPCLHHWQRENAHFWRVFAFVCSTNIRKSNNNNWKSLFSAPCCLPAAPVWDINSFIYAICAWLNARRNGGEHTRRQRKSELPQCCVNEAHFLHHFAIVWNCTEIHSVIGIIAIAIYWVALRFAIQVRWWHPSRSLVVAWIEISIYFVSIDICRVFRKLMFIWCVFLYLAKSIGIFDYCWPLLLWSGLLQHSREINANQFRSSGQLSAVVDAMSTTVNSHIFAFGTIRRIHTKHFQWQTNGCWAVVRKSNQN